MSEERGLLRSIAWQELCPWLLLFRTYRLAVDPRKLLLAAAALWLTAAGWQVLRWGMYSADADDALRPADVRAYGVWPWDAWAGPRGADLGIEAWPVGLSPADMAPGWETTNPILSPWQQLAAPFRQLFSTQVGWGDLLFYLLAGLWGLAVWALCGGAITRLAAVELAREDRLSWTSLRRHMRAKWREYFSAPLLPLLAIALGVVLLLPLGWLMRLDAGLLLGGLVWPLVLLAGAVMTIFVIGLFFGWPLMWGAISAEGMDSWDALSRSFAYVYQRPLHYLFYTALTAVLGGLAWLFVSAFATLVIYLGAWGVSWGASSQRMAQVTPAIDAPVAAIPPVDAAPPGSMHRTGRWLIGMWESGVRLLALAFAYSFFWTGAMGIYFLLRKEADNTPLDDVALDEREEVYGLPPPEVAAESADGADV